jgi:hypothetical protein
MNRKWITVAALAVVGAGALAAACGGSQGPEGPPGLTGDAGAPGTQGMTGTMGTPGTSGEAGAVGSTGEAGAQGPAGEAGAIGPALIVSDTAKHGLDIAPVPLKLTGLTADQLEQVGNGSYIVNALADCASCHGGAPAYLGGGCLTPADGGAPSCTGASFTVPAGGDAGLTTVYTRNLTPDSTGLPLTLDQFVSAIRTGTDYHSGSAHQLVVMPWPAFRWMSAYDLQSVYAYLKVIPAVSNAVPSDVNNVTPPSTLPVEPAAYTDGDWLAARPLPPETIAVADGGAPAPDPGNVLRGLAVNPLSEIDTSTASMDLTTLSLFGRGSYLVNAIGDCSGCHTNRDAPTGAITTTIYLNGGQVFDVPPFLWSQGYVRAASADLIGATNGFFQSQNADFPTFEELITQGIHAEDPNPQRPVSWPMPWDKLRYMTLEDMQAVYTYMFQVATQYGSIHTPDRVIPDPARFCAPGTSCPSGYACSSTTGPGECLNQTCTTGTVLTACAVCQTCASGHCAVMTGGALAACEGAGY